MRAQQRTSSPKSTAPPSPCAPHHLAALRVHVMLLGPEIGMREYADARLFGTFGVPLKVYSGIKWVLCPYSLLSPLSILPRHYLADDIFYFHLFTSFISPAFRRTLRSFAPQVIHLVDPIWLGVQALITLHILFPGTQILTSHHANLPTYAEIFGWFTCHSPALRASWGASSPADVVILSVGRLSREKNLSIRVSVGCFYRGDPRPRFKARSITDKIEPP
ncbi:hypothetical protein B0H13DRAFT_2653611 [Mycena leptocephala]|nr:hypothetical protein B0H13DRAFT_2653611 [Mycena leptocephala]